MFGLMTAKTIRNFRQIIPTVMKRTQLYEYSSSAKLEDTFRSAVDNLKKLKEEPENDVKLKLYGLYKQSTTGPNTAPKPSVFNIVDKAKWEAWTAVQSLSADDAMNAYIKTVNQLLEESGLTGDASGAGPEPQLLVENKSGVCWIRYNRPKKYNAITNEMYEDFVKALENAGSDDSIKLAIITANGNYFSSGNDLSNFTKMAAMFKGDLKAGTEAAAKVLQRFVAAFIDFPKPLIGAVNGPAIGISVTTLGLMDCVVASDSATFQTPFSSLGQSPEACATYTFPAIMGYSRASEMLYFNYKMTAKEALDCNFVSKIIPSTQFQSYLEEWLHGEKGLVNTCYPKSMQFSKGLIRNEEIRMRLHNVNKDECDIIQERWISEECTQALQKFFTRKQSNL